MELRYSIPGTLTSESKSGYTTDQDSWPAGMSEEDEPGPGAAHRAMSCDSRGEPQSSVLSPSGRTDASDDTRESNESTPDREHVLMGVNHLLAAHAYGTHPGNRTLHDTPLPDEAPISDNPLFDEALTAAVAEEGPDGAHSCAVDQPASAVSSPLSSNEACCSPSGALLDGQGPLGQGRSFGECRLGPGNTREAHSSSAAGEYLEDPADDVQQTTNSEARFEKVGQRSGDRAEELQDILPSRGLFDTGAMPIKYSSQISEVEELESAVDEDDWGKPEEEDVVGEDSQNVDTQAGKRKGPEGSKLERDAADFPSETPQQRQSRSSVRLAGGSTDLVPSLRYIQPSAAAGGPHSETHAALEEGQPQSSHSYHVVQSSETRVSEQDPAARPWVGCNTGDHDDSDVIRMELMPDPHPEGVDTGDVRKRAAVCLNGEDDTNEMCQLTSLDARTRGKPGGLARMVEGSSKDACLHSELGHPDVVEVARQVVSQDCIESVQAQHHQEFRHDLLATAEAGDVVHSLEVLVDEKLQLEVDQGALHHTKAGALPVAGHEVDSATSEVGSPASPHTEEIKIPLSADFHVRTQQDLIGDMIHWDVDVSHSAGDDTSEIGRARGTARNGGEINFSSVSAESSEDFEVLALPVASHAADVAPRCSEQGLASVTAGTAEGAKDGLSGDSTLSTADARAAFSEQRNMLVDVETDTSERSQESFQDGAGSWREGDRVRQESLNVEPYQEGVYAHSSGGVESEQESGVSADALTKQANGLQSSTMQALEDASAVEDGARRLGRQGADAAHAAEHAELTWNSLAPAVHAFQRVYEETETCTADLIKCQRDPCGPAVQSVEGFNTPPGREWRGENPSEGLCESEKEDEGRSASSEKGELRMPLNALMETETPVSGAESVESEAEDVWESEEEEFGVLNLAQPPQ